MEGLRNPRTPNELLVARLTLVTLVVIAIDVVSAFFFYLLEHDASGTEVRNYEQAFFWTTSQLTSVSSSIRNPLTTGGHILAIGIDVIAVGVVTVLVATIAQHLHIVSPPREAYFRQRASKKGQDGKTSSGS